MSQGEELFPNLGTCKSGPTREMHKVTINLGTQESFSNAFSFLFFFFWLLAQLAGS